MTDDRPRPPDLQQWIAEAGGYHRIDWVKWDAANAQYQIDRRAYLGGPISQEEARIIQKRKKA